MAGGAARLREAVDRKLKTNSGKLATLLLEKAVKGDRPSIRLVVSLAEQYQPKEEVFNPGPLLSQALKWAAEPHWVDPPASDDWQMWVDPKAQKLKVEESGMERGGRTASQLPFSEPN